MAGSGGINAHPHPVSRAYPYDEQSNLPHTLHIPGVIAPINTLPNEVLIKILAQTWFVIKYGTQKRPTVALVCSRWTSILRDCPEFWAAGLEEQTFRLRSGRKRSTLTDLATLLRRSSPYPVALRFDGYLDSVSKILVPHASRVTSFRITVYERWDLDPFYGLLSDDFLRTLGELQVQYHEQGADDEYYPSISEYDISPLPVDRLPSLRRLVIPGLFLPKTIPASLRHLTVGPDHRIPALKDFLSLLVQCRALETLRLHAAFPDLEAAFGAAPVDYHTRVLLPALRLLRLEDRAAYIGSVLSHLDLSADVHVHLSGQDHEWCEDEELNGLSKMLPPHISSVLRINHMELMFYVRTSVTHNSPRPYISVIGRRGDEECLRADVFSPSSSLSEIVRVFPSASITHLSVLHLCIEDAAWSWDVLLLATKALISLDVRGCHVTDVLFALQQSSNPADAIPCPALSSLCVDFEASTKGVAEEYLQEEVFTDVETLIRARVSALTRTLRHREERGTRLMSLKFLDTRYEYPNTEILRGVYEDRQTVLKRKAPVEAVVIQLLEPVRALVDGPVVFGNYRVLDGDEHQHSPHWNMLFGLSPYRIRVTAKCRDRGRSREEQGTDAERGGRLRRGWQQS